MNVRCYDEHSVYMRVCWHLAYTKQIRGSEAIRWVELTDEEYETLRQEVLDGVPPGVFKEGSHITSFSGYPIKVGNQFTYQLEAGEKPATASLHVFPGGNGEVH